jgi:hypothetical protein
VHICGAMTLLQDMVTHRRDTLLLLLLAWNWICMHVQHVETSTSKVRSRFKTNRNRAFVAALGIWRSEKIERYNLEYKVIRLKGYKLDL